MSDSPDSCEQSRHLELMRSLERQSAAMERLADLLPQLVALNQMLLEAMADKGEAERGAKYLDGSAV